MGFDGLLVTEIFHSLQGETSLSGKRFAFIRLTGCNLRCTYCDSAYAFKGGRRMSLDEVLTTLKPFKVGDALLTGGEPLLQRQTPELARLLRERGYRVSIETHGEVSVESVAGVARIVMDIKTPASGMHAGREKWRQNLRFLRAGDEIKFVIAAPEDYAFARDLVRSGELPTDVEVLFSAAVPAPGMPGRFAGVELRWLAERILEDRLDVRLQTQLHKLIWGAEKTGV